MFQLVLRIVWFVATTAVVYLYYTYLHFQPAPGALVVRAHGLTALFMSAMVALPMLFLGRLVFRVRNEMIAAGRPSFLELGAAFLIALVTPVIVIGPPPVVPVQFYDFIIRLNQGLPLVTKSDLFQIAHWSPAHVARILILTLAAFIVVRTSRVAYRSHPKRVGCVLAYLWMWYTGTLLFIGMAFI